MTERLTFPEELLVVANAELARLREVNAELLEASRTSIACIETAQQAITETTGRPWIGGAIDKHLNEVRAVIAKATTDDA